jgi:hypothetical protein
MKVFVTCFFMVLAFLFSHSNNLQFTFFIKKKKSQFYFTFNYLNWITMFKLFQGSTYHMLCGLVKHCQMDRFS